jgi:hypothetical protein
MIMDVLNFAVLHGRELKNSDKGIKNVTFEQVDRFD